MTTTPSDENPYETSPSPGFEHETIDKLRAQLAASEAVASDLHRKLIEVHNKSRRLLLQAMLPARDWSTVADDDLTIVALDDAAKLRNELAALEETEQQVADVGAQVEDATRKLAALVDGLRGVIELASKATRDDAHHRLMCLIAAIRVTIQSAAPEKPGDSP